MNEKISFSELFFQPVKHLLPLSLATEIPDDVRDSIFIYDVENHLSGYVNSKFGGFSGKTDDAEESTVGFQRPVRNDDVAKLERPLNKGLPGIPGQYFYHDALRQNRG